ncbi:MAG: cupin domain-containing protein [Pseudomonadota bacterium]
MKVPDSTPLALAGLSDYSEGAIVSRSVIQSEAGNITFFAFAEGEVLSPHSAPYDAFVAVVEGRAMIMVGGVENHLSAGQMIIMPANVPHAVQAETAFKMLLVMIKGKRPVGS